MSYTLLPGQSFLPSGISNYALGMVTTGPYLSPNFLDSRAIQSLVKAAYTTVVRVFTADLGTDSDATLDTYYTAITNAGCVMLVNLQHPWDDARCQHIVTHYGSRCLLYEFGNEPSLYTSPTVSTTQYNSYWTTTIPHLRSINAAAAYMGPAIIVGDPGGYLSSWLTAVVSSGILPDAVSFHMYCSDTSETKEMALAAYYYVYTEDIRQQVTTALGHEVAICLTEWNFDSGFPPGAWGTDPTFMIPFTTNAWGAITAAGPALACIFNICSGAGGGGGLLDLIDSVTQAPRPNGQYSTLASLFAAAQHAPVTPPPVPISAYASVIQADTPLWYGRGDSRDVSGNAHNGTMVGYVELGQAGLLPYDPMTSMNFGGSGYISVPTATLPTGAHAWSMECWFLWPTLELTNYDGLMDMGTRVSTEEVSFYYDQVSGKLSNGTFGEVDVEATPAVVANQVYYGVITYDGTTSTIDLYSSLGRVSTSAARTINLVQTHAGIGGTANVAVPFTGRGQEFAFYGYALSGTQKAAHYAAGTTPPPPSFGYANYKNIIEPNLVAALAAKNLLNVVSLIGPETTMQNDAWLSSAAADLSGTLEGYIRHAFPTGATDISSGGIEVAMDTLVPTILAHDPTGIVLQGEMGSGYYGPGPQVAGYQYGVEMTDFAVQLARAKMSAFIAYLLDDDMTGTMWGMWKLTDPLGGAPLRPWFFPWSLLCKSIAEGSTLYAPAQPSTNDLRVLAAESPQGAWTFVLVNRAGGARTLRLSVPFAPPATQTLQQYIYAEAVPRVVDGNGFPLPAGTITANLARGFSVPMAGNSVLILTQQTATQTTIYNVKRPPLQKRR